MKPLPVLIVLLIGIAIGAMFGYQRWHRANHTFMVLGNNGKMIPHVMPGETLSWRKPGKKGVTVKFLYGGGLCAGPPDQTISECTVLPGTATTHLRYYTYQCVSDNCQDPDAGGGSDVVVVGSQGQTPPASTVAATGLAPLAVHIYCDSGTSAADPNPAAPAKGQVIAWEPSGTAGDNWAVGPDLTAVCNTAKYDDTNAADGCTVLQNAPATTSYTVSTMGCKDSKAVINVAQVAQ
jgi:hypothetical protein